MNTDLFTSAALATAVIGFMIQTLVPAEPQALAAPSQAGNFSCDEKIEAQRLKVPSALGLNTRFCETPAGQQSLGWLTTITLAGVWVHDRRHLAQWPLQGYG